MEAGAAINYLLLIYSLVLFCTTIWILYKWVCLKKPIEKDDIITFVFLIITPILFLFPVTLPKIFKGLIIDCEISGETAGQISDTIGGTTAPFIGLLSTYLVYRAFQAQIKANRSAQKQFKKQEKQFNLQLKLQQDQFTIQSVNEIFRQLIENYSKNIEKGYTVKIPHSRRKIVEPDKMIIELYSFWNKEIRNPLVLYKNQNPAFPVEKLISNHLSQIKIKYYDEYKALAEFNSLGLSIFAFTYYQLKQITGDIIQENYFEDRIYWFFWYKLSLAERELIIETLIIYYYEKDIDKNRKEILKYFIEFVNRKDKDAFDNFIDTKSIFGNIINELLL